MSFLRRAGVVFALAMAVLSSVAVGANAAPADVVTTSTSEATVVAMTDYCYYADGQSFNVTSPDGRTRFVFQSDGNLVVYVDGAWKWASWTQGRGAWFCIQGDGNLVVYSASWEPLWNSGTNGHPGSWLVIQNDGNVVLYKDASFTGYWWTTNTYRR